jgi:hypothetical protein
VVVVSAYRFLLIVLSVSFVRMLPGFFYRIGKIGAVVDSQISQSFIEVREKCIHNVHFISLERLFLVSVLLLQLLAATTSQSSFSGSAKWHTCGMYFLGMSLLLCNFLPLPCSRLLCLALSFESSYSRL